jgi:hypothetical protein
MAAKPVIDLDIVIPSPFMCARVAALRFAITLHCAILCAPIRRMLCHCHIPA